MFCYCVLIFFFFGRVDGGEGKERRLWELLKCGERWCAVIVVEGSFGVLLLELAYIVEKLILFAILRFLDG